MKEKNSLEVFSSMPIPKAVLANALPAIAAMIMVLVYNLADTFFIGQTHDDLQVAAVSLATPVFLIFTSIGTVFGIGGTSVISRAMGAGRKEYAKKVCSFCMWSCILVGIVLALVLWIFMDGILGLVGASENTRELTRGYLSIVACCGPFVLISNCFSNVLRAEGQSTKAMMGMLLGNLANVILDPIMILGFGWNIQGAAIATVIGNVIGAGYYLLYFLSKQTMLSISLKDFTLRDHVFIGVLSIGVPAALGSLLMSVAQIIMNSMMSSYGDMAVAAAGVAMKVTMITVMIAMGLGQGIQPLLGYCYGAKNWERYRGVMRFSMVAALLMGCVLTGFCYLFVNNIVGIFLTDPSAFEYGVQFAKILLSTGALFGVYYVLTNAIQAMGAAVSSLIINLSRQGLIYIPALFLFRVLFGAHGLIWAQPAADILSFLLAVILYLYVSKKMVTPGKILLQEKTVSMAEEV